MYQVLFSIHSSWVLTFLTILFIAPFADALSSHLLS